MNELRHSAYLCTPSGNRVQGFALRTRISSILRIFSEPLKRGCKKTCVFLQPLTFLAFTGIYSHPPNNPGKNFEI